MRRNGGHFRDHVSLKCALLRLLLCAISIVLAFLKDSFNPIGNVVMVINPAASDALVQQVVRPP
ncbi:17391_t:CDS:1, partial [Gigaspora margarita]